MKRRGKETGKVTIPQTKVSPDWSGGSHKTKALTMHIGVVKKPRAMALERMEKRKKKRSIEEA